MGVEAVKLAVSVLLALTVKEEVELVETTVLPFFQLVKV